MTISANLVELGVVYGDGPRRLVRGRTCVVVVPWNSADWRRRRYRLFLILPGSKELAHHGILQRHDPTGLVSFRSHLAWNVLRLASVCAAVTDTLRTLSNWR